MSRRPNLPCPPPVPLLTPFSLGDQTEDVTLLATSTSIIYIRLGGGSALLTYSSFIAQFTSGNLLGLTWAIGNDSSVDPNIYEACPIVLPLGPLYTLEGGIVCGVANPITDTVLGTPGSGLAQTVNSFEGPHS